MAKVRLKTNSDVSYRKLCEVCNQWSEDELSLVLEFLERLVSTIFIKKY